MQLKIDNAYLKGVLETNITEILRIQADHSMELTNLWIHQGRTSDSVLELEEFTLGKFDNSKLFKCLKIILNFNKYLLMCFRDFFLLSLTFLLQQIQTWRMSQCRFCLHQNYNFNIKRGLARIHGLVQGWPDFVSQGPFSVILKVPRVGNCKLKGWKGCTLAMSGLVVKADGP
jgi:hypothetical protein